MRRRLVATTALLVALAGCGDDGRAPATTAATTAVAPTTTTIPAEQYRQFAASTVLGPGLVLGSSLDGSHVYVEARDRARTSAECVRRDALARFLYRVPLAGGAGEEITAGGQPVHGALVRGPNGRIAVWQTRPSDEGTPCSDRMALYVGTETPDGRIPDLRPVQGSGLDGLVDMAWSADGARLVTFRFPPRARIGLEPVAILLLDPATATTTKVLDVNTRVVSGVAQLVSGAYVLAEQDSDNRNWIRLRDASGAIQAAYEGTSFAVSPQRTLVAVGGKTIRLLRPGDPPPLVVARANATLAPVAFSADDQALTFLSRVAATETLEVVTITDGRTSATTVTGAVGSPLFTFDGRHLVYTRLSPTETTVVALRLG